jgi:ABC-2 type transport system permease protein
MTTIFQHSFFRWRGQVLGWGISLALLGVFLVQFYDTLAGQQAQYNQLLQGLPPELMAFFGSNQDLFSPSGYLNIEFFSYMPIILGIFAILAGSGLLASDEENGTLDLVLAHPISRAALYWGRFLAYALASLAILAITWLGFVLSEGGTSMGVPWGGLGLPFLSLFSVLMFFGSLAALLSMLLPSRSLAAMLSGALLVASYFITSMANVNSSLEQVSKFSPLTYYQGGDAIQQMNWGWFAGLLGIAFLLTLLGWWRFERRDIRVGGEG